MTPLAPVITKFLQDYLPRQRGFSVHSTETYAQAFKLLLLFAADRTGTSPSRLRIEQLDAPLIQAFLEYLEDGRGNGPSTRNARLAAIKSFMRFVEYQYPALLAQVAQIRALPTKRFDQKLVQHLSRSEVQAILNAPDVTTRLGIRDRAMMHLCFAGGLRVSELVGATIDNLVLGHAPSLPWERAKVSALPALESDGRGSACLARCQRQRIRPRDLRQCGRTRDDAVGARVRARQACGDCLPAVRFPGGTFGLATSASP